MFSLLGDVHRTVGRKCICLELSEDHQGYVEDSAYRFVRSRHIMGVERALSSTYSIKSIEETVGSEMRDRDLNSGIGGNMLIVCRRLGAQA